MTSTKFLQHMSGNDFRPATRVSALTGSATAGTRSTHAHGLGYTPKAVIPVATATDADGALTADITDIAVVSFDATDVVVRCGAASATFDLIIFG